MASLLRPWMLVATALFLLGSAASAQRNPALEDPGETRAALRKARADSEAAEKRAERLEAQAARATEAADRTATRAAALAARIQQSEAGIDAAEARLAIIGRQKEALSARLARKQRPLVKLTAALQRFSRRPLILSVLRPGSVQEVVYLRAMVSTALPQVRQRTADLRSELLRGKALEREARQALDYFRKSERELAERRKALAALETKQRLASRRASGTAAREAERALALAEQVRDLDTLIGRLATAANLRERLAALPGPILRPPRPAQSVVVDEPVTSRTSSGAAPAEYQLPVTGRILAGFGSVSSGGTRSEGLTIAARSGAQVVAPAAGRVVFAGPYRGYGRIVIIEHPHGWTSLVTGLIRVDADVGQQVLGGSPLGIAPPSRSSVSLELRREGTPVNPLDYLG